MDKVASSLDNRIQEFWNQRAAEVSRFFWYPVDRRHMVDHMYSKTLTFRDYLLNHRPYTEEELTEQARKKREVNHQRRLKSECQPKTSKQQSRRSRRRRRGRKYGVHSELKLPPQMAETATLFDVAGSIQVTPKYPSPEVPGEDEKKDLICRKVRIYPNWRQKRYFRRCFGVTRKIYNDTLTFVKQCDKDYLERYDEALDRASTLGHCIHRKDGIQCVQPFKKRNKFFCEDHCDQKIERGYSLTLPSLRQQVLVPDRDLPADHYMREVPYDSRQDAVKEYVAAHRSGISNLVNHDRPFNIHKRSKKAPTQVFHLPPNAIMKDRRFCIRRKFAWKKTAKSDEAKMIGLGRLRMKPKAQRWFERHFHRDHRWSIMKSGADDYHLLMRFTRKPKRSEAPYETVSLDPGIRTFQTFYSPDGVAGKVGHKLAANLYWKCFRRHDTLQSKQQIIKTKLKKARKKLYAARLISDEELITRLRERIFQLRRRRRNMLKRLRKLRTKAKNTVRDVHWQTASFLVRHFRTIIVPNFQPHDIPQKWQDRLKSKAVRAMFQLSHGKFRERLAEKCRQYGRRLISTSEAYTSQTCGRCGRLNVGLGGNAWYTCGHCGLRIDRDYNGARNITIRVVSQ